MILERLEDRQLLAADALTLSSELASAKAVLSDSGLAVAPPLKLSTTPIALQAEGERLLGQIHTDLVAFAQLLKESGTVFYGADWSAESAAQKRLFEDGAKHLPYVDATNPDRTAKPLGTDNEIEEYPTWIFPDESRLTGVQSLNTIAERAGLRMPTSAVPYLEPLEDVEVARGSPLHIPMDGYHPAGLPLSISVSSDSPELIEATVLTGNRSLMIGTDFGDMTFQLFEDKAPRPAERVIQLAQDGFYDGIIFHRVIDGFMIQGGDPTGTGTSGSELGSFDDQFHLDLQHNRSGVLSFAKSNDDTNNSQFFITEGPTRHLDFNHSIFGQLVEGDWVREAISNTQTVAQDRPVHDVVMRSVTVLEDTENGLVLLRALGNSSGSANITVTVSDGKNSTARTFVATVVADTVNGAPFLDEIPSTLEATAGKPLQYTLTSQDKEGDPVRYGVRALGPVDYEVSIEEETGVLTLIPPNDFEGELLLGVWVQRVNPLPNEFDTQIITVEVSYPVWQNESEPLDVNADGRISAIDALAVINYLNSGRPRELAGSGFVPPPYIDVNGDGRVSSIDALLIINHLNRRSLGGGGEGETGSPRASGAESPRPNARHSFALPEHNFPKPTLDDDLIRLLARPSGALNSSFHRKWDTLFAELGSTNEE